MAEDTKRLVDEIVFVDPSGHKHTFKSSEGHAFSIEASQVGYKVVEDYKETRLRENSVLNIEEERTCFNFTFFTAEGRKVGTADLSTAWVPVKKFDGLALDFGSKVN